MNEIPPIITERVDDIPLLLEQMQRMGLPALFDHHFPTHGNWQGLSLGWVSTIWLSSILSRGDHRMVHVEPWVSKRIGTLVATTGQAVTRTDFTDDRLESILRRVSHDECWGAFESALNQHTVRVYDLSCERVHVDSTSASAYTTVSEGGLFQFGHSKDYRPDLPQVKVMQAVLDPLGMPLATDVESGERADDPLYLPCIARVQVSVGRHGLLYVGDCKMASRETRARLVVPGDFYLCPLPQVQLAEGELDTALEAVWRGEQLLSPVRREGPQGALEVIAEGYEYAVAMSQQVDEQVQTWTERRLVVRSVRQAHAAEVALRARVAKAIAQIEGSCRAIVRVIHIGSKRGMISPSTTGVEGLMMPSDLGCSPFACVLFILLGLLLCRLWRGGKTPPLAHKPPRPKRQPKPFAGLTCQPACAACEQGAGSHPQAPGAPPPRMRLTRGRHRHVETTGHFCPHAPCAYHGRVNWGNLRANGHPNGRRWRQLYCLGCRGDFLETLGTPFHGKHVEPDTLGWAIAALAEGLGIRAVARGFETDPPTVLGWLVEAAEHLEAFSRHFLRDLHVEQVQRDERFTLLSAVKDGEVTAAEAIADLERSPAWVWVAMDPVCKLILAVDVGKRSLAMAQRLVHQVTQVLAPHCAPLFLTDGFREYLTALVTHDGPWSQPAPRQGKGPWPKPRWMPQPGLLYAQVVKSSRRRRIVGGQHRVIFGAAQAIESILATRGWTIHTSVVERRNLDFRQHVAAIGQRVNTLGKHDAGLRHQLTLFQTYHNFVLPHASLRVPLPAVLPGAGTVTRWPQRTPALAAGLTDHVWRLREVLRCRGPPGPQHEGYE
jgi:IS1 family transposase